MIVTGVFKDNVEGEIFPLGSSRFCSNFDMNGRESVAWMDIKLIYFARWRREYFLHGRYRSLLVNIGRQTIMIGKQRRCSAFKAGSSETSASGLIPVSANLGKRVPFFPEYFPNGFWDGRPRDSNHIIARNRFVVPTQNRG